MFLFFYLHVTEEKPLPVQHVMLHFLMYELGKSFQFLSQVKTFELVLTKTNLTLSQVCLVLGK